MKLSVAVLADQANIAAGGKLNVFGIFDRVWAARYPAIHPFMVLVLRLRAEFADGGKTYKLRIRLIDEDGREVMKGEGELAVPPIPAGEIQSHNMILTFAGIQFRRAGSYAFHIEQDTEEIGRVDLTLAIGSGPPRQ